MFSSGILDKLVPICLCVHLQLLHKRWSATTSRYGACHVCEILNGLDINALYIFEQTNPSQNQQGHIHTRNRRSFDEPKYVFAWFLRAIHSNQLIVSFIFSFKTKHFTQEPNNRALRPIPTVSEVKHRQIYKKT